VQCVSLFRLSIFYDSYKGFSIRIVQSTQFLHALYCFYYCIVSVLINNITDYWSINRITFTLYARKRHSLCSVNSTTIFDDFYMYYGGQARSVNGS